MSSGNEWPSGGYGLPKPKSGCPAGNGWQEGWRFQDMDDSHKFSRSTISPGSHMSVKLIGDKKDINRTFCMKENIGNQTTDWPKGKIGLSQLCRVSESSRGRQLLLLA